MVRQGKLKCGFAYEIPEESFDDWELLVVLRKVDKGEGGYIVDVAERLFGEEQLTTLTEYLRSEGHVSANAMAEAVAEVLEAQEESKN